MKYSLKPEGNPPPVRYNKWYVALWVVNILALAAIFALGVSPLAWFSWFLGLFLIPEIIGLLHNHDSLPPLTYVTRRYLPEWLTYILTGLLATWLEVGWVKIHPLLISLAIVGMAFWLIEHWMVSYASKGDGE